MADDIIGIDLGTTNSAVGVVESGFPILLANADGKRITPSAVSYEGEVTVGAAALRRRGAGGAVVTSAKRYMGSRYAEVKDDDFCVPLSEDGEGNVVFDVGERSVSPEEVSAEILGYLKGVAETQLGRSVSKAIITVPAYFNDAQRTATKRAGEMAGLEVVRIISEPTAAALAYGLDKLGMDESARVVVYDYGGGTFDVSVLEIKEGVFQVLATAGDTRLGGDHIDEIVAQWCCEEVEGLEYDELDNHEREQLLGAARKLKEKLTSADGEDGGEVLQIPFFRADVNIDLSLSLEQFNKLIHGEISRTVRYCKQVLLDADVTVDALDKVILVGGSTRIPAVQELVEKVFGMKPDTSQHPDEAVALGAVIQGGMLSGALREMVLLDVTPLSLGIETLGGLMNVIIPRNTTIPCKAGEMFTNAVANQESMCVRVLQGEREMARDNWELGRVEVSFSPAAKGQARMGVQFAIDENGILEVLTRDVGTGKDTILEINSAAVDVADEAVEKMVTESVDYAFDDMAERVFTEAKLKAEELLPAVDAGLAQVSDDMDPEDLTEIQSAAAAVREALQGDNANQLKAAVQKLDKSTEHMAAVLVEKAMEAALMRKMGD
ncbi:MAG: Hsp70 family protein [Akkermansiaceae bacterium]